MYSTAASAEQYSSSTITLRCTFVRGKMYACADNEHNTPQRRQFVDVPLPVTSDTPAGELSPAFIEHTIRNQSSVQLHTHSATCHKGDVGKVACRLARPSGLSEVDEIVELVEDESQPCRVAKQNVTPRDPALHAKRPIHVPLPEETRENLYLQVSRPLIRLRLRRGEESEEESWYV